MYIIRMTQLNKLSMYVFFNRISYAIINIGLVAYILVEADEHALVLRDEDVSNFYERLQG